MLAKQKLLTITANGCLNSYHAMVIRKMGTVMQQSDEFKQLCNEAKSRIQELNVDEVKNTLETEGCDLLIDVRDADEYEKGYINGAVHLSKGWLEAKIHQLTDNKSASIVLYCGGGNRSALAADNLQQMGYSNVYSMRGGYKEWMKQGF